MALCRNRPTRAVFLLFRAGFPWLSQTINCPFECLKFVEIPSFRCLEDWGLFPRKVLTLFLHFLEAKRYLNLSKRNSYSYRMFHLLVFLSVVLPPLHFALQRRCPEEDTHWLVEILRRLPPPLVQSCRRQNELSEILFVLDTLTCTQARKQTPTVCGWNKRKECHQYLNNSTKRKKK